MDGYDGVLYPVPELLPFFLHPNLPMQIRFTPTDAADQRILHPTPATFPQHSLIANCMAVEDVEDYLST